MEKIEEPKCPYCGTDHDYDEYYDCETDYDSDYLYRNFYFDCKTCGYSFTYVEEYKLFSTHNEK